jgi:hypothetical protein
VDEHDPALRKRLELPPWDADGDETPGETGGADAHPLPRLTWLRPGETDHGDETDHGGETDHQSEPRAAEPRPIDDLAGSPGEDGARTLPSEDEEPGDWPRSEGGGDIFESAGQVGTDTASDVEDLGLRD